MVVSQILRKSHAICGTVCGAPREAFSSFVFPGFLGRADDDVEQLQLAAQYDVGSPLVFFENFRFRLFRKLSFSV